jgi:RimJ/RimL family protein N-acetyltransferase
LNTGVFRIIKSRNIDRAEYNHLLLFLNMIEIVESGTEHLLLRQWKIADREPFAALNADPRVMAYFPAPLTRAESDAMADRCQKLIDERGWGFWAVELKTTCEFIGFVGLHIPSAELPFSPCVEVGWRWHMVTGVKASQLKQQSKPFTSVLIGSV